MIKERVESLKGLALIFESLRTPLQCSNLEAIVWIVQSDNAVQV